MSQLNTKELIKELIIKTIKRDGNRKIPPGIIVKKILDEHSYLSKTKIYSVVDEMIANNELKKLPDNKVVLGYIDAEVDMSTIYEGTISINSNFDGFIAIFNENNDLVEEFYINKIHTNGALKGDLVKFALLKKEPSPQGLREASVIEIVKRHKHTFVAEILLDEYTYQVIPDDTKIYLDIEINNLDGIQNHDKVLLQIDEYQKNKICASVKRIIGNKSNLGVDIESVAYENNVPIDFSEDAILESEQLKFNITELDKKLRKDIRDRYIMTIDPATSKDLDDAIYVEKLPNNNYFLSVSIADVASYVQPDTSLDTSAFNRGTSVYLVDRVIPMLPSNISDNLCSLNPHEDKMTITCDMEINAHGDIVNIDVYPSIMNNHCRLSYDEVNQLLDDNFEIKDKPFSSQVIQQLKIAYELHNILRFKKLSLGYIEFDIKEPKITLNDQGIPIAIDVKKSGTAQKIIEDFMVACNEAVTLFVQQHNLPFIYRIHDKPDVKKINTFMIEAKKLGFFCNIDYANLKSKDFLDLLEANKNHSEFPILNKILLRSMQKAKYTIDNIGHFGLALDNYTHFTSPIRRYSDLIVHRILWMFLFAKDIYSDAQRFALKQKLEEIAQECNLCETRQVETERNVNSMKFAEYMSYHVGNKYSGSVSAVTSYGLFVELDNLIEGLVMIKNIADDFYVFNPETLTIMGRRTSKVYSLGTRVNIEVIGANKQERKIDFKIVK